MTEVIATRKFEFRYASKGNVSKIVGQINDRLANTVNRNRCDAFATIDPEDPLVIVVEMRCATGSDIYSVDKDTIFRVIAESEKDRIEHEIGSLELQT